MFYHREVRLQRMKVLFVLALTLSLVSAFDFLTGSALAQTPPKLPIEAFAQLPQVSSPRISPDGKYLAMMRPYEGKDHLFIQTVDGSVDPVVIPPNEKFELYDFEWASNERLLISIAYQGWRGATPTFETRLIGANRDGSNIRSVVQPKRVEKVGTRLGKSEINAQIQHDIVDYLRNDPDHFILSVDGDMDGSDELRLIDIHTGQYTELYGEFRGVQNWMADQQGNIRFGWGVDNRSIGGAGRTRNRRVTYRHADGDFSDFLEYEISQSGFTAWDFLEIPDQVLMHGPGNNGTGVFIKYDLRQKTVIETFEKEGRDATHLYYDPSNGIPIGVGFRDGTSSAVFFDPEWAKRYRMINKALPNTSNKIVSSNAARTLHIIRSRSDLDSGVYYVFDAPSKRISQLALVYDGLDPAHMAPMQTVSYEARDGLAIPAILTLPLGSDGKNLPTVIMPHGGPQARDEITFDYWVQFFANRGYAVLQPNFRGSTGYGTAFRRAGYEQWGLKMQDDVTDGTEWMIEQGIADPARICIVGSSYGGYAALMGVVKEPNLYACAVSVNGVADIPKYMNDARKYIGGALDTDHINQTGQKDISPTHQVDSIKAPVLLIAAKDDRNVDYRQSKGMASALKKAKKKYKYVEMKSGDHGLTTEEARMTFLKKAEKFLAEHIGKGR